MTAPETKWGNLAASTVPGLSGMIRPSCSDKMLRGLINSAGSYFLNFGKGLFGTAKGRFLVLLAGA